MALLMIHASTTYVDYWGSGFSVTPGLHATNSSGRLAASCLICFLAQQPVIKPKPDNPPPTFRCPSRTRPRRSLPLLSPYTTTFPCVNLS